MARYFFHTRDGRTPPDAEGSELPSLEAARVEAVRMSGELLKWHAETFWKEGEWSLEVTDDTGLTLFTLHFVAITAPAIRKRPDRPAS
ncbi:hypothetical protein SAMN02745194_05041 [Roseomonas rosea]|uniref:DUF6894 domain-containing protein n=1 Tax=Muricoccus roseus TaxID=198092 RepID=A0A1M6SYW5_9PROT|nr:hypothetical protein [Roseomonas rosea]SHK49857.1 hypothetical protein SAMN02745194_05041 [Roseomonas rosea]